MNPAPRIRQYREAHHLTQKQLAKMLGLKDEQMIARWEKGQYAISGPARTLMILLIAEWDGATSTVTDMMVAIATENFRDEMKKALTPI